MSSTGSYDEVQTSLEMLAESEEESESDTMSDAVSEFVLEHLMDLLSLDGDDIDTVSGVEHTPGQETESSTSECTDQDEISPDCWIGLSIGWPQTDVSVRVFGMVHWSHTPHVTTSTEYVLPRTLMYDRTPLGPLNGMSEYDIPEPRSLLYPDELLPLP